MTSLSPTDSVWKFCFVFLIWQIVTIHVHTILLIGNEWVIRNRPHSVLSPAVPWRTERCDFRSEPLFRCRKVSSPTGASFISYPGLCHDSTRSALLVRFRILVRSSALGSATWCPCCGLDTDPAVLFIEWTGSRWAEFPPPTGRCCRGSPVPRVSSSAPQRHLMAIELNGWLTDCVFQVRKLLVTHSTARRNSVPPVSSAADWRKDGTAPRWWAQTLQPSAKAYTSATEAGERK